MQHSPSQKQQYQQSRQQQAYYYAPSPASGAVASEPRFYDSHPTPPIVSSTYSATPLSSPTRPRLKRSHAAANSHTLASVGGQDDATGTAAAGGVLGQGIYAGATPSTLLGVLPAIHEVSPTSEESSTTAGLSSARQSTSYNGENPELESDINLELDARDHRSKRARIVPPSDAFAQMTLDVSPLGTGMKIPDAPPQSTTPAMGFVAPPPQPPPPPPLSPSAGKVKELHDIDMRLTNGGKTSWEIAPGRIYVASLDDSDDEGEKDDPARRSPAATSETSADLDAMTDSTTMSELRPLQLIARAPLPFSDPIPRLDRSSPSSSADPSAGSLILYRPPPHLHLSGESSQDADGQDDEEKERRRLERAEALQAFRREQEMREREIDVDFDTEAIEADGMDLDS